MGGKRNPVSADQGRSRRASNKMSRNVSACLGPLPVPCFAVHPLTNRHNTNQRHVITPRSQGRQQSGTPRIRYAKNQVCQEQVSSRTSINGPSVTHRTTTTTLLLHDHQVRVIKDANGNVLTSEESELKGNHVRSGIRTHASRGDCDLNAAP